MFSTTHCAAIRPRLQTAGFGSSPIAILCYFLELALASVFKRTGGDKTAMLIPCDRGQTYELTASNSTLLCVDFQSDFLSESGMAAKRGLPIHKLQRILAPAERILCSAREIGMSIIHLRESYAPDLSDLNAYRRVCDSIVGAVGPLGRFLIRGEAGTRIVPQMEPLPHEPVIDKAGFNGFFRTPLDDMLKERGVSRVVIIGLTTQVCISSTLRGAVDCGYFPLLLADCCAAFRDEDHEASISVIFSENHQFGRVSDSVRFLAALAVSA